MLMYVYLCSGDLQLTSSDDHCTFSVEQNVVMIW